MDTTDAVVASSRYVRIVVVSFLAAVLPLYLGLQLFTAHVGQSTRDVVHASDCDGGVCELSAEVVSVVASLESGGMTCRAKPALTDSVVFEWLNGGVEVIDFGAALAASSDSQGWVRQYCLP